jgi:carbonic anhydrase
MNRLIAVQKSEDILESYQDTPIGSLIEYHNLDRAFETYQSAQLLVGMCMDHRKHLHIPDNFSYIIRTGGANLRYSEFKVSYAISVGGIQHIALIGHNNCGMVNLHSKREQFIEGMIKNAGWDAQKAEEHFMTYAPLFEIENETDFVVNEARRLREKYPEITIAPMFYDVNDNQLYFVHE